MITEAIEKVQASADELKNDTRRSPEMDELDYVRQGDLYLVKIPSLPAGATEIPGEAQLATGNTQGSRHTLSTLAGVRMFRLQNPNALQGPILEIEKALTLEHPEHGHIDLGPGRYAVTYQRTFAKDQALQRVAD